MNRSGVRVPKKAQKFPQNILILDNLFFASAITQSLMFLGYFLFALTPFKAFVNQGQEAKVVAVQDIQHNIVLDKKENIAGKDNAFHFADYSFEAIDNQKENVPVIYSETLFRLFIPDNQIPLYKGVSNSLFSRPPPVFS
jgi:hypothetical protein